MAQNNCETHNVDVDSLDGYDRCPYCQMRERQAMHQAEMAQRHAPRAIDDPASIEAYRR